MDIRVKDFFYASNLLSLLRIVLVIPIVVFMLQNTTNSNYLAVLLMFVAALTDSFDGRLARRWQQQSDVGRILDPVADKIAVAAIAFVLVKNRDLPLWFLVVVVGRDALIVLFSVFLISRAKVVAESNKIGKVTVTAIAGVLVFYTLDMAPAKQFFLWTSVTLVILSSVFYFFKMRKLLQES